MFSRSRISAVVLLGALSVARGAKAQVSAPAAAEPAPEAPPAVAQPPAEPAKVSFSLDLSVKGCATTDQQLTAAILTRVPDARRLDSTADVTFTAEIANAGTSSLLVTLPQGSSRRDFHGASCDEAAAIIAFIAALVLDARPEERLHATEMASLPDEATPVQKQPEPEPPVAPSHVESQADRSAASTNSKPRFGLSAAATLETAVAPTPPLGALVGAHLRWERVGWLSPELRAELLVTGTATQPAKVGEVHLSLMAGRLSACPLRFHSLKALQVTACATFDGGRLHAQGSSAIDGQPSPMPWFAGGASVRTDVPLGQTLELEFLLGLKMLAHHDNFTLDPDATVVYAVPLFSGGFALGLGFRP